MYIWLAFGLRVAATFALLGAMNPRLVLAPFRRFVRSEEGPTAVEYAVMMALIIIVCLASIKSIGTKANTSFNNVATSLASAS